MLKTENSTAADGSENREFVAVRDGRFAPDIFLIHGEQERLATERGKPPDDLIDRIARGSIRLHLDLDLALPDGISRCAEE